VADSPSASGALGLVRGQFFDRQGRLVASAAQEGLIRQRRQRLSVSLPRPLGARYDAPHVEPPRIR